jgi:hypothetical protein
MKYETRIIGRLLTMVILLKEIVDYGFIDNTIIHLQSCYVQRNPSVSSGSTACGGNPITNPVIIPGNHTEITCTSCKTTYTIHPEDYEIEIINNNTKDVKIHKCISDNLFVSCKSCYVAVNKFKATNGVCPSCLLKQ